MIEIREVANGYIVMPSTGERGLFVSDDSRYVFQTFAELVNWLSKHFGHRERDLLNDEA